MPTCVVDGCDSPSGLPGSAKKMCRAHYGKLRKYGDPTVQVRRIGRPPCSVEGCGKESRGRGLCGAHWWVWRQHGDPLHRKPGEIVNGKRVCSRCHLDRPISDYGVRPSRSTGLATYCKDCERVIAAEWRLANPDYRQPRDPERERVAARKFRQRYPGYRLRYKNRIALYAKRWRDKYPEKVKTHGSARSARRRLAYIEPVSPLAVFERDNWICRICLQPINPTAPRRWPNGASVDHVAPLSRGGKHSMSNVQAAHLQCNMRKGARTLAVV